MTELPVLDLPSPSEDRESARSVLIKALSDPPYGIVLRRSGFLALSADHRSSFVRELTELVGPVSDSNRFDERSGVFVDEVAPTDPTSKDVTFSLGACEAHSDESSKIQPEDVVFLWCVRPAADGGDSLLWPTPLLTADIAAQPGGASALETLRRTDFLFGGRLRNPPRVLHGPVLFGQDGIRFRLGSVLDAQEASGVRISAGKEAALRALADSVARTEPYRYSLQAGDVLVFMNRKSLHARSAFTDQSRLLLRTRCFCPQLSNSAEDDARWL